MILLLKYVLIKINKLCATRVKEILWKVVWAISVNIVFVFVLINTSQYISRIKNNTVRTMTHAYTGNQQLKHIKGSIVLNTQLRGAFSNTVTAQLHRLESHPRTYWCSANMTSWSQWARRPLAGGVGTGRAPPPSCDQQPAWWYHMLAEPPHRSKMAASKLTDRTASDSHRGVMRVLFTPWEQ